MTAICTASFALLPLAQIRARPLEQKQIQEEDLKPEFRLKVAEWELRKALAGPSANKVQVADIQKLMPDEFNRKLKEWELMKISSPGNERCGNLQNGVKY